MSHATLANDLWQNDVDELRRRRAENLALKARIDAATALLSHAAKTPGYPLTPSEVLAALAPPRAVKRRGRKT